MPTISPVRGEDDDAEVLRCDLEAREAEGIFVASNSNPYKDTKTEIEEDVSKNLVVLEAEVRDVVTKMLNLEEPQVNSALPIDNVIPFVEFGGHHIYKSTLVSQLNANPFVSKDRLTRVRNSIYFNNSDDYISAGSSQETMLVGLGMDCGVYFVQQRTTSASSSEGKRSRGRPSKRKQVTCVFNSVDEGSWCIGRVQKMRRKVDSSWGNCRQPIDLL